VHDDLGWTVALFLWRSVAFAMIWNTTSMPGFGYCQSKAAAMIDGDRQVRTVSASSGLPAAAIVRCRSRKPGVGRVFHEPFTILVDAQWTMVIRICSIATCTKSRRDISSGYSVIFAVECLVLVMLFVTERYRMSGHGLQQSDAARSNVVA
jgi:hypothetical protein